ncbi:MAG: DUF3047 domain-containing protein [Rhodospirillaceae bacterium]|nr:DUF3047 domain-containing protein [Rhodospirillaceae bacterium]
MATAPRTLATRLGALCLSLVLLSGCAVKQATVAPEGLLNVLGPFPGFSAVDLPGDWVIESDGDLGDAQLTVVNKDGVPAIKVINGEGEFIVVRRTRAMMLATPYLSWSWNIEPPAATGFHPVRLVIGFAGVGDPDSKGGWKAQSFSMLGSRLPEHDRAVSLTWGESALQRGSLSPGVSGSTRTAPRFTVRGGRENAGSWWLETVDLADIYARTWPGEDASRVQVVFIGIAAAAGREPAPVYVSGIILTR